MVFEKAPSVPNWCRMCNFMAELVFIATQLRDQYVYKSEHFKKALGYLSQAPKRIPAGQTLSAEEWETMNFYSESEERTMTQAFEQFDSRLAEWAISLDGDEDVPDPSEAQVLAKAIWQQRLTAEKGKMSIFKSPMGRSQFRSQPFAWLGRQMKEELVLPNLEVPYLPQLSEEETMRPYERAMLETTQDIHYGVSLLASDALSEGRARGRAGSAGEIEQEDEIQSRYRAAGRKGLREFVAQVLRDPRWARPNGHPNTDKGRQRCYNRVYALENPLRRAKK